MTVTLDGENTFSYDHVYFTAVMNQKYEGGGFKFCPDAQPDDQVLDVILVEGIRKIKLLFCLPTAFSESMWASGEYIFSPAEISRYIVRPLFPFILTGNLAEFAKI